jgi:hypothetical protein
MIHVKIISFNFCISSITVITLQKNELNFVYFDQRNDKETRGKNEYKNITH